MLKVLLILFALGIVTYLGIVGMVCWKETHIPAADSFDAIIVLGAQVKPDGEPSVQLSWRLDAAIEQWKQHPCPIVVCGAQGKDEPAPEALVMRDYLISAGVTEDLILTDPDSVNTRQNLVNASSLLKHLNVGTVMIVTSDYHLPRAIALAGDEGLSATGIGSPCRNEFVFWAKNHGREALSWIKYWVQKYLRINLE